MPNSPLLHTLKLATEIHLIFFMMIFYDDCNYFPEIITMSKQGALICNVKEREKPFFDLQKW